MSEFADVKISEDKSRGRAKQVVLSRASAEEVFATGMFLKQEAPPNDRRAWEQPAVSLLLSALSRRTMDVFLQYTRNDRRFCFVPKSGVFE